MATTAKTVYVTDRNYGKTPVYIATNENYVNVICTAEMGYPKGATTPTSKSGMSVTMHLQRYTGGSWKTIDSASSKHLSSGSRVTNTFTNIAKKSTRMRVRCRFGNGQTYYSNTWNR